MEPSLDVKSNWRNALSVRHLSLRGLARETGISHTYLSGIIAGKTLPSEPLRLRLLEFFEGCRPEDLFGLPITAEKTASGINCKRCQSGRTIKSGRFHGNQRYQCKDCGCVFIDNNAPLHGCLPVEAVVIVLEHFFAGEPLDTIRTLIEDSRGISITVSGLEKVIYRYARKALRLAGDILPQVHAKWLLEGVYISGVRPMLLMDVLDLNSGFIISSGIIRKSVKEKESAPQKALRITGLTPEILILGSGLSGDFVNDEMRSKFDNVVLTPREKFISQMYTDSRDARTRIISRRLNFDSMVNTGLICDAWRIHYNFLSVFKPAGESLYGSWLDIVNAANYKEGL